MWFSWLEGLLSDLWNKHPSWETPKIRFHCFTKYPTGILTRTYTFSHMRSHPHINSYQRSDAFHIHTDTWVINGQSIHGMFWHAHTPTLTILSQSACMCEVLYRGLGSASRYFVLSVFHCSSDQKPWRLLACSQMYTEASSTATATKQGQNNRG